MQKNGRDSEIRTRDLLTPSQTFLSTKITFLVNLWQICVKSSLTGLIVHATLGLKGKQSERLLL